MTLKATSSTVHPADLRELIGEMIPASSYTSTEMNRTYGKIAKANGRRPASPTAVGIALRESGLGRRRIQGRTMWTLKP